MQTKHRNAYYSELCFLVFLITKQFYLLSSGSFQIGDLFLMLSFLLYSVERRWRYQISKEDKALACFVIFVFIVNSVYSFLYIRTPNHFVRSSFYYLYNLIGVVLFKNLAKSAEMLKKILFTAKINTYIQLGIYFLNMGKYQGRRYISTFNDPNQFAFFVLSNLFLILVLGVLTGEKKHFLHYIISFYLIYISASTAMLMTFFILLLINLFQYYRTLKKRRQKILMSIVLLLVGLFVVILLLSNLFNLNILYYRTGSLTIRRILQKIAVFQGKGTGNYANIGEDRNWRLLWLYPEKLIFGAGQGLYSRFKKVRIVHEVHSTVFGILFSYGILPTTLFCYWVHRSLRTIPSKVYGVYFSLIIESFFLVNQRQPIFWILIACGTLFNDCRSGGVLNGADFPNKRGIYDPGKEGFLKV